MDKLLPGPPLEFRAAISRTARQVRFTWRNFLMSDFAATVIARGNGEIIYRGTGTNFVWTTDADGPQTFTYWSENKAGDKSRLEPFQTRVVEGLSYAGKPSCLVLAEPGERPDGALEMLAIFQQQATNWICDLACRPHSQPAQWVSLFQGNSPYAAVLPDFSAMVDYAITNRYRLILAPVSDPADTDLSRFAPLWRRATDAGIAVVIPHSGLWPDSWAVARQKQPVSLDAAITVGYGVTTNLLTFGPGLEFFDAAPAQKNGLNFNYDENASAAVLAAKLAEVMQAHPDYNLWDARQHLRQSASYYTSGWGETNGYGRPPSAPTRSSR